LGRVLIAALLAAFAPGAVAEDVYKHTHPSGRIKKLPEQASERAAKLDPLRASALAAAIARTTGSVSRRSVEMWKRRKRGSMTPSLGATRCAKRVITI
jgi:hypothetical protein